MIKVLQLVGGGMAIGGVEKMLLNYYALMDKSRVRFDFCFFRKSTLEADEAVANGLLSDSKIFDLQLFEKKGSIGGYLSSVNKVAKILKNNKYDVVHINAGRPPLLICGLIAAKIARTKCIIIHSHSTKGKSDRTFFSDIVYNMMFALVRPIFRKYANVLAACSTEAAKYMFGENAVKLPKYRAIRNAIVVPPFVYNDNVRKMVRHEIGNADDPFIVGHIGSFSVPKNHLFLIDVFSEIKKRKPNSRLWLAGNGNLREEVVEYVKKKALDNDVVFLGQRSDANRLYQAMDIMVFPSLWEGLSVSVVEAQAASLPVFASSNISPEHKITECLHFLDLSKGSEKWADTILSMTDDMPERKNMTEQITSGGYNIEVESKSLEDFYIKSVTWQ